MKKKTFVKEFEDIRDTFVYTEFEDEGYILLSYDDDSIKDEAYEAYYYMKKLYGNEID